MSGTSANGYGALASSGEFSTCRDHSLDICPINALNLSCTKVSTAAEGISESRRGDVVGPADADKDGARLNGGASAGGTNVGSHITKYLSPSRSPEDIVSGIE